MTLLEIIIVLSLAILFLVVLDYIYIIRRFKRFMESQQSLNETYVSKVYEHFVETFGSASEDVDEKSNKRQGV
ncbi:MAG TPA: hypothetical protein PLP48_00350 [Acholeplasmataceae bacterium]|nr:hypothetical protein [Acholeplasmataceae bacterium]